MAGMFYSLKDVMAKMNKTEDEVSALVKQGRLREFRDGPNVLFKIDEVESLMSDTTFMAAQKGDAKPQEEEVELVIEGEEEKPKSDADTTAVASEGINVLGETDTEISLTDDTLAATRASGATAIIEGALSGSKPGTGEASIEELEQNVNLDTFGSGSGLLDLSLQADDTSLGGILDEIYTPEGEEGKEAKEAKEGSEIELAAEADQLAEQPPVAAAEAMPAEEVTTGVAAAAPALYIEAAPDAANKMLSTMLFVPLLAVVYAIIVAMAGQKEIASSVLALKGLTWPIVGGAALITAILSGMAFMGGGPKKPKAPKPKKEKKSKKGKKEEPVAEAAAAGTTAVAVSGEPVESAAKSGSGTAESADLMNVEGMPADEDLKLEDLDLSDVKDISDEDKL